VAEKSTTINSKTWDALLRFLLAVNDVLLAPPTEKGLRCLAFYGVLHFFCCRSDSQQGMCLVACVLMFVGSL